MNRMTLMIGPTLTPAQVAHLREALDEMPSQESVRIAQGDGGVVWVGGIEGDDSTIEIPPEEKP